MAEKSSTLNRVSSMWNQMKSETQNRWSKLADVDMKDIKDRGDMIVKKIRKGYDMAKDGANHQLDEWAKRRLKKR